MFDAEATRLRRILLEYGDISPLLNLGSSTGAFRRRIRPHIENCLFAPLRAAGVEVVHSDLKAAEGVDIVGDILDASTRVRLVAGRFRGVLISNVLEHVRDRRAVAAACEEIAGPGGFILASAPSSYPYHADPIDTGYRPGPEELASLFEASRVIRAEEVAGRTYGEDLRARGLTIRGEAARTALAMLAAPVRPRALASRLDRWRWLERRYRASIALVVVNEAGPPQHDARATLQLPTCNLRNESQP